MNNRPKAQIDQSKTGIDLVFLISIYQPLSTNIRCSFFAITSSLSILKKYILHSPIANNFPFNINEPHGEL